MLPQKSPKPGIEAVTVRLAVQCSINRAISKFLLGLQQFFRYIMTNSCSNLVCGSSTSAHLVASN